MLIQTTPNAILAAVREATTDESEEVEAFARRIFETLSDYDLRTDEGKVFAQMRIWRAMEALGYEPTHRAVVEIRRAAFAADR